MVMLVNSALFMMTFFMKFREDLLGPSKKSVDEISRTAGLDNYGIVGLQRQIMKGISYLFWYRLNLTTVISCAYVLLLVLYRAR